MLCPWALAQDPILDGLKLVANNAYKTYHHHEAKAERYYKSLDDSTLGRGKKNIKNPAPIKVDDLSRTQKKCLSHHCAASELRQMNNLLADTLQRPETKVKRIPGDSLLPAEKRVKALNLVGDYLLQDTLTLTDKQHRAFNRFQRLRDKGIRLALGRNSFEGTAEDKRAIEQIQSRMKVQNSLYQKHGQAIMNSPMAALDRTLKGLSEDWRVRHGQIWTKKTTRKATIKDRE